MSFSPLLFNLYSHHMFKEALYNVPDTTKANGKLSNNIRYAENTVPFVDTADGLCLMNLVSARRGAIGLRITTWKTNTVICRALNNQCNIQLYD